MTAFEDDRPRFGLHGVGESRLRPFGLNVRLEAELHQGHEHGEAKAGNLWTKRAKIRPGLNPIKNNNMYSQACNYSIFSQNYIHKCSKILSYRACIYL